MKRLPAIALTLATSLMFGCAGELDEPPEPGSGTQSSHIIDGKPATAYPEAVMIFAKGYPEGRYAAGVVIAPRVVLTADYVVEGYDSWEVTAPNANRQKAGSIRGIAFEWDMVDDCGIGCEVLSAITGSDDFDDEYHGVGLLFLDNAIRLPIYPEIATEPLVDGEVVVRIGSNDAGEYDGDLYVSPPDRVRDGARLNLPVDYVAENKTLFGDGGGPVLKAGVAPREPNKIVAINWGYGNGETFFADFWSSPDERKYDYLSRVDVVADWIHDQVELHGGGF